MSYRAALVALSCGLLPEAVFAAEMTPRSIEAAQQVSGKLSAGGGDCYQVDLPKGDQTVTLRQVPFASNVQVFRGARCDADVPLAEADGAAGRTVEVPFKSVGGRYIVVVRGKGSGAGAYHMTVAGGEAAEAPKTAEAAPAKSTAKPQAASELPAEAFAGLENTPAAPAAPPEDPRVALMKRQQLAYQVAQAEEAARRAEEARQAELRRMREEEERERRAEEARIERQEKEARSQAMWGAILQGVQTVADGYVQAKNDQMATQARLNALNADRQRAQAEANAARLRAQQQQQQQQQQSSSNAQLAAQLAQANATRNQMIARTSDPAEKARLEAYNQKAAQIAKERGLDKEFQAAQKTAIGQLPQQQQQAFNQIASVMPNIAAQQSPKPNGVVQSSQTIGKAEVCIPKGLGATDPDYSACRARGGITSTMGGSQSGQGTRLASNTPGKTGGSGNVPGGGTPGGGSQTPPKTTPPTTRPGDELILWPEAVAICTVQENGKLDVCKGPRSSGIIEGDEGRLRDADCAKHHDLGQQQQYKIYGCGYGIDPNANERSFAEAHHWDWIKVKGLAQPPGRRQYRCKKNWTNYCLTPA